MSFMLVKLVKRLDRRTLTDLSRWDDWVTEERLRKLTEENRELAAHLKRNLEASLRLKQTKSTSKKRATSDRSSVRDSEDPSSAMAPFQRGNKRARGDQHLQSVSVFRCCRRETAPPKHCLPSLHFFSPPPPLFTPTTFVSSIHLLSLYIVFPFLNHHAGCQCDHLRSLRHRWHVGSL